MMSGAADSGPATPVEAAPSHATRRVVDLEDRPRYGYMDEQVIKFGEPFDTLIATGDLDGEGAGCSHCDNGVGSYTFDAFPDEGHRMAMGWRWVTLIANEAGQVWLLCETCSRVLAPPPPPDDSRLE